MKLSATMTAMTALGLALIACKQLSPNHASGTKDSGEVMTGKEVLTRTCGLGAQGAAPEDAREATYAQLPSRLRENFPIDSVQLIGNQEDINQECPKATGITGAGGENWYACFGMSDKGSMRVMLLSDPGVIYTNMINMVAWAYMQQIDQIPANGSPEALELKQRLQTARATMASEFLGLITDDSIKQAHAKRFGGSAEDLASNTKFQNYVLGETAEEFYCSEDPDRPIMTPTLTKVRDAFRAFELHFGLTEDKSKISAAKPSTDTSDPLTDDGAAATTSQQ